MNHDLIDALGISQGIVCAVGAGGKKSALYAIANRFQGRLAITASVAVTNFPHRLRAHRVIVNARALATDVHQAAREHARIAYACPSEKKGRMTGVAPEQITDLHRRCGFDLTLVKADGARMRKLKAPKEGEPVLPPGTHTVLPVVSVQAVGKTLDEDTAHRVERVSAVTGARAEDTLTAEHVARLLTAGQGALQYTEGMRVVPIINMVDDVRWQETGREIAHLALAGTNRFQRVVLACMHSDEPLVEVITAQARPSRAMEEGRTP